MQFIEDIEIEEWCAAHGIVFASRLRPVIDARFTHDAGLAYASGRRSGREAAVANSCAAALGAWDECLLWVTEWGVFPSGEDWPKYYAARGYRGERRSLDKAPGHLFDSSEEHHVIEFLTLTLENAWDAFLAPVTGTESPKVLVEISHDEWISVHSVAPVTLAAVDG